MGDLVDRRRFLLVTRVLTLAAAALGGLAIARLVTPWSLLALLFAVGTGQPLDQRPDGPQRHVRRRNLYRHEIRPALTTGAEATDRIFATKKGSQTA
jgi:hypothetical protein